MKCLINWMIYGFVLTGSIAAYSQTEGTLYFMNSIPQVVDANPAIMPRYRMAIGLPFLSSVGTTYTNNGFTYSDMTTKVNGVTQADLSKWTANLAEENYIQMSSQTDFFRFGMRISPTVYIMASSTAKAYNRFMIPKGLATLFVDGTAPIVGSYSNTSPQEESNTMVETNVGVAYQASSKLTIGGRLKFLVGQSNITTDASSLVVEVNNAYQISATGQASARTSGIAQLSQSGEPEGWTQYLKNNGWGIDIGATFKPIEKLTLGASLTEIGFITWRNNTVGYTLDPAKAHYTFSGLDLNKLVDGDASYLRSQEDSLRRKFQMTETPIGSYTTMIPGKFYLSGTYEIMRNLSVGTLFFTEKFRGRISSGITTSLNKQFGKTLSTSLSYTISNRSYNNLGLGISVNVQPVQLYIVGDNLLMAPVSLLTDQNLNSYINNTQVLTLRAGLNIVLGWDKGTTKKEKVSDDSHNPKETSGAKVKSTYGRTPEKAKKKTKVNRERK